ncbi:hypothetical protein EV174_003213 [Coemansia sp. RSA 2320]|nr:hypothetical protein EV174_003213 [Coemansia sp. RSA 2320]
MASYEDERAQQIRENAEFLASLGIEKPVAAKKAIPRKRKLVQEQGGEDYRPEVEYSFRRRRTDISYRDDDYRYSLASYSKKSKKTNGGSGMPRRKSSNLGRRVVGGRVYDSVLGHSCHQCRQKTVDIKIKCSAEACNIMFDYRCLLIRYSEDADTIDHSTWICPKCRGTCNCSFCMKKRGRMPTGQLSVFIKYNGIDAAKELTTSDDICPDVLRPPRRRHRSTFEGLETGNESDGYGSDCGVDSTVCSDQGIKTERPKRFSLRTTNSATRKKIAALANLSDDEFAIESLDSPCRDRVWGGWSRGDYCIK